MAILSTLNRDKFGSWSTLLAFLQDLNRRETGSLAALAAALIAPPDEQKELAQGEALLVLADLAGDLRVQKGARLAAIRCCIEAGISGPPLATLFIGGGELATDPRLGAAAKRLVEAGLPEALSNPAAEAARVSLGAGAFAKALQASSSVVGAARLKELIGVPGAAHAGVNAGYFALGQAPLPAGEIEAWKKLLREACTANKRAPAAAKRIGMAPPWPPNLPEAFKDLIDEAEKFAASVVTIDATKGGVISGRAGPAEAPAGKAPPGTAPPKAAATAPAVQSRAQASPRAGSIGAPLPQGARSSMTETPAAAPALAPTASGVPGKLQEAIKRSPFRRPTGTVMEGPFVTATRRMPEVAGQVSPGTPSEGTAAAPPGKEPPAKTARAAPANVPGGAARTAATTSAILPGLAPLLSSAAPEQTGFDARGKRLPQDDRFHAGQDDWQWVDPILPPSELKPIQRRPPAPGPFAARLKSLFDDKPEAVDRLCAAADARAAIAGEVRLESELQAELALPAWNGKRASRSQLARLRAIEAAADQPPSWRRAAAALLKWLPSIE